MTDATRRLGALIPADNVASQVCLVAVSYTVSAPSSILWALGLLVVAGYNASRDSD
jgi:hypothetical protein